MSNNGTKLKAPIIVDRRVVKHLSLGLYRNFALAIKELISNSYDAGATEVKLKLDLEKGRIILRDNGRGINEDEFKEEYLNIGRFKEPSKTVDDVGRMRIGTFGVGFLAPLPYCKTVRIITKKRNEKYTIEGEIVAEDFFKKGNWDIKDTDVEYRKYESDLSLKDGETIIILETIKEQISSELKRTTNISRSIEGSGYEKFKWTLAQYCPIQFPLNQKDIREFFKVEKRVPMRLFLDGEELFRNVPKGVQILEKDNKNFGEIELKYTILSPNEPVHPEEMRGFQLRLKDVAIGFPRDFDVTKLGRVLGKLNMLCGEINITKGLDNALLVNRDSFNFTKDVAEMYAFFRNRITHWNTRLYDLAEGDKQVYLALGELRFDDRIVSGLKKAGILHFSKERLRLSDGYLTKSKYKTVGDQFNKLLSVLKERSGDFNVIVKKGKLESDVAAIEVNEKLKSIYIYKHHPAFDEIILLYEMEYKVKYDEWNPNTTSYSICKVNNENKTVKFNKAHSLFKSKLSEKIIKKLSLGLLIILRDTENNESLLKEINNLIEDIFTGK